MVLSGRRKRVEAPPEPGDDNQRRVENRHGEDEYRNHPRNERGVGRETKLDGQARKRESEKQASRVAHEDGRGVQIIEQEPQTCTEHCRREGADKVLTAHQSEQQEIQGCDGRDPATQPIHVIEQVHCVGDTHHPQHRRCDIECIRREQPDTDIGQRDNAGREELPCELHPRR